MMTVLKPTKKHEPMKCLQGRNMRNGGKEVLSKAVRIVSQERESAGFTFATSI